MWNWQRLQQTSRQLRGILNLLTDVAPRHKVSHRSPHPGPPHARKQGSTHLASSKMAPKRSTVLLLHEQLPQTTPMWDDQLLCTISSNTHKQVNTMPRNNPEVRGLPHAHAQPAWTCQYLSHQMWQQTHAAERRVPLSKY